MASAPRYSFGPEDDTGDFGAFVTCTLLAAVVLGALYPRRSALTGALVGLPALVLSPWTAPRGDNDGLWVLVVPSLAVFLVMLTAVASFAGRVSEALLRRCRT